MEIFGFSIIFDWSWLEELMHQSLPEIVWFFFINGGWIIFTLVVLWGAWKLFVFTQQNRWGDKQAFLLLAIDIPKDNLQTPKAVENIFTALAGAHTPLEWGEKNFEGKYQLAFSFEIVSIDGYVQFVIRTPVHFRSLVEASIYSQYPDAEITEVEDYAAKVEVTFPNDEYNIWGADMILVNKDYYPIKTYLEFMDEKAEDFFKDPMAALLEVMSKIGPGEQIWLQLIALPADNDWMFVGRKALDKIMGTTPPVKKNILDKVSDIPLDVLAHVDRAFLTGGDVEEVKKDKREFDINMLSPIQRREVEAIANKIDKINFNCKFRYVYFGKKEVFKKPLGVSGVMGSIKQFNSTGLNGFRPGGNKTQARLAFSKFRLAILQNGILSNYKKRNPWTTVGTYILSVEELATLWHFPYMTVKAPLVKKIDAKRASAPIGLPIDVVAEPGEPEEPSSAEATGGEGEIAPVVDYDTDYFEDRFAVDKTRETDKKRKEKIMKQLEEKKQEENTAPRVTRHGTRNTDHKTKDTEQNEEKKGDGSPPANLPFV